MTDDAQFLHTLANKIFNTFATILTPMLIMLSVFVAAGCCVIQNYNNRACKTCNFPLVIFGTTCATTINAHLVAKCYGAYAVAFVLANVWLAAAVLYVMLTIRPITSPKIFIIAAMVINAYATIHDGGVREWLVLNVPVAVLLFVAFASNFENGPIVGIFIHLISAFLLGVIVIAAELSTNVSIMVGIFVILFEIVLVRCGPVNDQDYHTQDAAYRKIMSDFYFIKNGKPVPPNSDNVYKIDNFLSGVTFCSEKLYVLITQRTKGVPDYEICLGNRKENTETMKIQCKISRTILLTLIEPSPFCGCLSSRDSIVCHPLCEYRSCSNVSVCNECTLRFILADVFPSMDSIAAASEECTIIGSRSIS